MTSLTVMVVDAFTREQRGGNPAGVAILSDEISVDHMKWVAAKMALSETAFVRILDENQTAIRFFTPTSEVALCGHATIAAHHVLFTSQRINSGMLTMVTNAGTQQVFISEDGTVGMTQNRPLFGSILDREVVAKTLGLTHTDLCSNLPVQMASTGLQKIFVPLKSRDSLSRIQPNFDAIKKVSLSHGAIGMYCYALDSHADFTAYCRNFAPVVGIKEDSATGTSAAALSCLLYRFGVLGRDDDIQCRYAQGDAIGRPSELVVRLIIQGDDVDTVWVSGRAVETGRVSVEWSE